MIVETTLDLVKTDKKATLKEGGRNISLRISS